MKIVTWNVNGLRACINKGALEPLLGLDADVICLQEIKARADQLTDSQMAAFDGYDLIWHSATRPGYSGVLTLSKQKYGAHYLGIDSQDADQEGRAIRLEIGDVSLFNIYFPNGRRDHSRVDYKLAYYSKLLKLCDRLHQEGRKVIICGDFNTAHHEIDLKNPKPNKNSTGFLQSERDWVSKFIEHGFVDIFRSTYAEKVQYTWWTYRNNARSRNIGWRLDYFLVSQGLGERTREIVIHDEIMGSDHCPVSLSLDI